MLKHLLISCALLLTSCTALEMFKGEEIVQNLERDVPDLLAKDVLGAFVPDQSYTGHILAIIGSCAMAYAGYLIKFKPKVKSAPQTPTVPPAV